MADNADGNETFRGQFLWICDSEGKNCKNIPLSGTLLPDGTAASNIKIKDKELKASPFTQSNLDPVNRILVGISTFLFVKNKGTADITLTLYCGVGVNDIVIVVEPNETFAEDIIPFMGITFSAGATFKAYTKA